MQQSETCTKSEQLSALTTHQQNPERESWFTQEFNVPEQAENDFDCHHTSSRIRYV
jgi:hypothetical protein